jgi:DNA transformation protein
MAVSQSFLEFVLEQLEPLGEVTARRMFGGAGLYRGDVFFAVVDGDTVFFKVDDASVGAYKTAGMRPWRPYPDKPATSAGYYQLPVTVLEDRDELARWAGRAVEVGRSSRKAKAPRGRRRNARKRTSV